MKKWVIGNPDPAVVSAMQSRSDLSKLCCSVLAAQGCETISDAAALIGCSELSDPFLLCDMQEAADRINRALDEGERICIFGDYDCDGVMATAILYSFLSEIGADVTWRIPERSEGYGLSEKAVREMHEDGVQLIVTVDNGISAIGEAKLIAELGMELVITDHHQPGRELPQACAVVDAHREDNYSPFRLYCGAGIALLLVAALNEGDTEMALEQFGDLAAIATIADVVSLTGENRYLVQMGLQYLENTERVGLRALREVSGIAERELSATNVAFSLSPRINAAGRMQSPTLAMELLLEDAHRARELAEQLNSINSSRKECEAQIIEAVLQSIAEDPRMLYERVLVFCGRQWHTGVMGIVASRLVERFGKPCIVISIDEGIAHGSARSFGSFSIFDCLTACDDLLVKYGGHPAAGGLTVKEENIPALRERIAQYAAQHHPVMPTLELQAACALQPEMLTISEVQSLSQLEPFGAGNPEPVFFVENARITEIRPLSGGLHTKLIVQLYGQSFEALLFRTSPEATGLSVGMVCHMMVKLGVNTYNGMSTVRMTVQDYRISGLKQLKILSAMQTYDQYKRGESLSSAVCRAICPTREECIAVYKEVTAKGTPIEQLMLQMYRQEINYCKMRICLDIFCELGLVRMDYRENKAVRCPTTKKADLQASVILRELQQKTEEEMESCPKKW
ncbi:MAG: single-stranded-DNA-specific exonuclease RecJ [Oscillospiraceae bacterium]|nr:single-stranded-DNA-specific exonuclease RecJ [Oscillospiraceae bacterium]